MGRKDSTVLRDFPAFNNRMIIATLQICKHWAREKYELNMGDSSWKSKGLNNLRKDGKILSGSAAPLLFFLMADNNSSMTVEIIIRFWQVGLADSAKVVQKNVCFGFDVSNNVTVVWNGFISWIDVWSTVQTLNNFLHVCSIRVGLRVLEKVFSTVCLGLYYSLGAFAASIDLFLLILINCLRNVIASADFSSHVWMHAKFRLLAWL